MSVHVSNEDLCVHGSVNRQGCVSVCPPDLCVHGSTGLCVPQVCVCM